jgi:hypothetical protein
MFDIVGAIKKIQQTTPLVLQVTVMIIVSFLVFGILAKLAVEGTIPVSVEVQAAINKSVTSFISVFETIGSALATAAGLIILVVVLVLFAVFLGFKGKEGKKGKGKMY